MQLEIQKDGVYNTDVANLFFSIEPVCDKSELTDEYCKKISELYKIYVIGTKTSDEKTRENMKNLFLIESLKLEKIRQKQIKTILSMDEIKLQQIFEESKKAMDEMIKSNPSDKKLLERYNVLTKVSLETFRQAIIAHYYKRFNIEPKDYDTMVEMISSLDENQIQLLNSININKELEKLIEQKGFDTKTTSLYKYPENPRYEDFKKSLWNIERDGFYSIGTIGSFVYNQTHNMCYEYYNQKNLQTNDAKNMI